MSELCTGWVPGLGKAGNCPQQHTDCIFFACTTALESQRCSCFHLSKELHCMFIVGVAMIPAPAICAKPLTSLLPVAAKQPASPALQGISTPAPLSTNREARFSFRAGTSTLLYTAKKPWAAPLQLRGPSLQLGCAAALWGQCGLPTNTHTAFLCAPDKLQMVAATLIHEWQPQQQHDIDGEQGGNDWSVWRAPWRCCMARSSRATLGSGNTTSTPGL